eukprot:jgi/Tetstr1/453412/TSEL_040394.t1
MKRALQVRQLKTSEELRRAPLLCGVITEILDHLATLPMTTPGYGTILREGAAVCSTCMFHSRGEPIVSSRLRDMAVDTHNITMFVNRERGGATSQASRHVQAPTPNPCHRRARLDSPSPPLHRLYRDAGFRAAPSAKQPDRFWALPADKATPPLTWNASTLGDWLTQAVARNNRASYTIFSSSSFF